VTRIRPDHKSPRATVRNGRDSAAQPQVGAEGLPLSAYPGWDARVAGIRHDDPARRPRFRRSRTRDESAKPD
jgi:hypothetical protein